MPDKKSFIKLLMSSTIQIIVDISVLDSVLNHWFDGFAILHRFSFYTGQITDTGKFIEKDGQATATLQNVPYGEYAIKLFHDEDNSGRFLTNAFGIPKVEYGFSNNAHGLFGPASFGKAKFQLNVDMDIAMQGH